MISAFNIPREDEEPYPNPGGSLAPPRGFTSSATHMRQLLIQCAELVSQLSDMSAAHRLLSHLSSISSPYGDSTDRLVHQFTRALSNRLSRHSFSNLVMVSSSSVSFSTYTCASASAPMATMIPSPSACGGAGIPSNTTGSAGRFDGSEEYDDLQYESSYIQLNQVTPYIRFSHLTATQAILEAIEEGGGQQSIHILDMDTMQGVQWPPLMQAIAGRWNPPPPMIRITGTGRDMDSLRRTGHHLENFAQTLGLRFQFHPLLLPDHQNHLLLDHLNRHLLSHHHENEMLAVNCVLYLHRLDSQDVRLFLGAIKAMNPKVVTLAEREANHNNPNFMQRVVEALDHYTALFDSLEATLPPNSRERLAVEQVWFGREIMDILSIEGEERRERHERFDSWLEIMRSSGFSNLPLSPFALSQAKLLLRLHYPSEGYQLHILKDSFFLGWQNRPLFSVSSWH